jgi:hypothetical protein
MSYKQGLNGKQGEDRTQQILGKRFKYSVYSVDIDGTDFGVELFPEERIIDERNRIQVTGRVQAKFFENNNEVKIAKEYVEDEEGVRTDFFALLHTDNDDDEICYFFDAKEIKENFRLRDEYYVFSLSKDRQFESFKGLRKIDINNRIEAGIRSTEEDRNQRFIKQIEQKYKCANPTKSHFEDYNNQLFKRIYNKPIVDKLYEALTQFKEFRRIVSWRLIDKISFLENHRTATLYNQFTLISNHSDIINFFNNLEIKKEVEIKNLNVFNETKSFKSKTSQIIQVLNENLIFNFKDSTSNKSIFIRTEKNKSCDCVSCKFDSLAFNNTYLTLQTSSNELELWDQMRNAYNWFKLGKYEKSKELYFEISERAKENKEQILFFFAKFNERLAAIKNFDDNYPDLEIELDKLYINDEKKDILKSIADYSLFNGYAKSIDDIYLKIRDFKQRTVINDTGQLVNKLYAKTAEYLNFFEGNWLLINEFDESKVLFEKFIESCIVSYSMKTEFSNHLSHFDDFFVEIALLHCNSNKLLGYFQRNNVNGLPYQSNTNYLQKAIDNLFSKENTDFLIDEICYFNHRTNNPYLRRRINRLFENICILLTYLDHSIDLNNFLANVLYFIEKLDFNVHELSLLAHPLLSKHELFKESDVIKLAKLLLTRKDLSEGYLITNCLYTLKEKNIIIDSDTEFANKLISQAIFKPQFGLLNVLKSVLSKECMQNLGHEVNNALNDSFDCRLYQNAVLSHAISNPLEYMDLYLNFYSSIRKDDSTPSFFYSNSPYTGICEPLRSNLNDLVKVLFMINEKEILQHPILKSITNEYPYYNFILNIDDYKQGDNFNAYWILENQSDTVLKKLSEVKAVKNSIKQFLSDEYNEKISKIFIKYFTS